MTPMTTEHPTTEYRRVEHLPEIRGTLLGIYAEVYADDIATNPFFSLERFEERLAGHTTAPEWGCVLARVAGEAVGFTYGFRAREGDTFTLCENMLRAPHRGQGIARSMHDELIRHREEALAQLLVRRERPRLRALYERWGYRHAGEKLPFPDSPLYDVMVLTLRQPKRRVAD
ncbi:GNAT family N-acetyltransferase [Streptomyces sp. NPDC059578]|uniref:GNAT family N-acetyltransferase n=1 Tax=Streptomyces sp. NPDC059578 TaxID=3346874 RepID=UPI0036A55A88